jgi:hypothetical protein
MPKRFSPFAIIWVVLVLVLASVVLGLLLRSGVFSSVPIDPYHPAYHGLPEEIAGSRVVMVITSEQDPCLREGFIIFMLQREEPGVMSFLQNQDEDNSELSTIQEEHPNWWIEYVEPEFNREYAINLQEARSSGFMTQCPGLESIPEGIIPFP